MSGQHSAGPGWPWGAPAPCDRPSSPARGDPSAGCRAGRALSGSLLEEVQHPACKQATLTEVTSEPRAPEKSLTRELSVLRCPPLQQGRKASRGHSGPSSASDARERPHEKPGWRRPAHQRPLTSPLTASGHQGLLLVSSLPYESTKMNWKRDFSSPTWVNYTPTWKKINLDPASL